MDIDQQSQTHTSSPKLRAVFRYISNLDLFRVVQDRDRHLTPATTSGSIISTITTFIISLLIIVETFRFFSGDVRSSMFVPSASRYKEPMEPVNIIVSFPKLPCHLVRAVVVDQEGQPLPDLIRPSNMKLYRLERGNIKRSLGEYHRGALHHAEGCRVEGHIMIDRVPGHFLIGALNGMEPGISADHVIHEMWIGKTRLGGLAGLRDGLSEDLINPLRDIKEVDHNPPGTVHKYYLQIVPTYFRKERHGTVVKEGYQYTATAAKAVAPNMPVGIYFSHRHSTLAVERRYRYDTWSHFIVSLCAIVGGVYTVMGFAAAACGIIASSPNLQGVAAVLTRPFTHKAPTAAGQ